MGDEQGGDADVQLDPPDLVPQLRPDLGVERGERLVEQQHLRLDGERARERDALLLAAGNLVRVPVRLGVQLYQLEHLHRPPVPFLRADPP